MNNTTTVSMKAFHEQARQIMAAFKLPKVSELKYLTFKKLLPSPVTAPLFSTTKK